MSQKNLSKPTQKLEGWQFPNLKLNKSSSIKLKIRNRKYSQYLFKLYFCWWIQHAICELLFRLPILHCYLKTKTWICRLLKNSIMNIPVYTRLSFIIHRWISKYFLATLTTPALFSQRLSAPSWSTKLSLFIKCIYINSMVTFSSFVFFSGNLFSLDLTW